MTTKNLPRCRTLGAGIARGEAAIADIEEEKPIGCDFTAHSLRKFPLFFFSSHLCFQTRMGTHSATIFHVFHILPQSIRPQCVVILLLHPHAPGPQPF